MTEDQIERRAEHVMNRLDRDFLAGKISQSEYDNAVMLLDKWAQFQYDHSNSCEYRS